MTAHELAELLRNSAVWLRPAGDRLEDGRLEDALNMTARGVALAEPLPRRVAELIEAAKVWIPLRRPAAFAAGRESGS